MRSGSNRHAVEPSAVSVAKGADHRNQRFGTWNKALKAAGFATRKNGLRYTTEEPLDQLRAETARSASYKDRHRRFG